MIKLILRFLVCGLGALCGSASGDVLPLLDGTKFEYKKIVRVEESGISFITETGIAKVPATNLTKETRAQYHIEERIPAPIVWTNTTLDDLLCELNMVLLPVKKAPTTILLGDAVKQVAKDAPPIFKNKMLVLEVEIRNVKMKDAKTATITFRDPQLPKLNRCPSVLDYHDFINSIDIPAIKENAQKILPGQTLILTGPVAYRHYSTWEAYGKDSVPCFMRLSCRDAYGRIFFVPQSFKIESIVSGKLP